MIYTNKRNQSFQITRVPETRDLRVAFEGRWLMDVGPCGDFIDYVVNPDHGLDMRRPAIEAAEDVANLLGLGWK